MLRGARSAARSRRFLNSSFSLLLLKTQSGGGRLFGATYSLGKCRWLEIVQAMKSLIPANTQEFIVSHIYRHLYLVLWCSGIVAVLQPQYLGAQEFCVKILKMGPIGR